ncbi:MAG: MATE family efflux transporter [Bacillota bacterium]|nr:MATE family efflux transporter [Bacillota bacterium]
MNILRKFKSLFDPIDLTTGSIHKKLIIFLIPILLSLIFQQIYTLSDAAIVGQFLPEEAVAGVNNAGSIVYMIVAFGEGATAGFSVILGTKIGIGDKDGERKSFFVQIVLCFFISIVITVSGILLAPWLLSLMGIVESQTDASMQAEYEAAYTYLVIIFGGSITSVFYNMIASSLRAKGDSFVPFLFLMSATIINIGADFLFITAFNWGVAGSAAATIMSQAFCAIASIIYALVRYKELRPKKEDWKQPWSFYWRHLRVGIPLGFQFSVLSIGIISMNSAVIRFDVTASGAMVPGLPAQIGYGAGAKVVNFLMCPLNALGMAMLSFTAQCYGVGDHKRIKQGIKDALLIGVCIWFIFDILIGGTLVLTGIYQRIFYAESKVAEQSLAYGNLYLYICLPGELILMVLFLFRNILQGLEKPLWPLLSGVGELLARFLICTYLPVLVNGGPTNSDSSMLAFAMVCCGDVGAWTISPLIALVPLIPYFRGKWPKAEDHKLA